MAIIGKLSVWRRALAMVGLVVVVGMSFGADEGYAHARSTSKRELSVGVTLPSCRDSLRAQIKFYTQMIGSWRDSLTGGDGEFALTKAQQDQLQASIGEISGVIEQISNELADLEFEIKDNRVSLVNEDGEGIVINVPDDLDGQVRDGIEAITRLVLSELPDSVGLDHPLRWDWSHFGADAVAPQRTVSNGNIVKIGDDLHVGADEDVRGNVVVVFGDVTIDGHIEGSVVCVGGDLTLGRTAEVSDKVVVAGGGIERDASAQVRGVVSVAPWLHDNMQDNLWSFWQNGVVSLVSQGLFVLMVCAAVLAMMLVPRRRSAAALTCLHRAVVPSLGVGLLAVVLGHSIFGGLVAILVLTVIGIPLALLALAVAAAVVVVAMALAGAAVGDWVWAKLGQAPPARWLAVAVGLSALHLASFVASVLGVIGGLAGLASVLAALGLGVMVLAYVMGLGALILSRFGSKATTVD